MNFLFPLFSREEYFWEGNWLGNCTDPKRLYEELVIRPYEFIDSIAVRTFEGEEFDIPNDDDSFWKPTDFINRYEDYPNIVEACYGLVIPEKLQMQGIRLVAGSIYNAHLAITPPRYLYQNLDIEFTYITSWLEIKMDYQINNFMKIGDEDCIPDPLFNRNDCVLKQLLHVCTTLKIFFCPLQFKYFSAFK